MIKYIMTKTVNLLLTLFIVITITFFILNSLPGTPLAYLGHSVSDQMKENFMTKHSLDLPLSMRYLLFLKNIFIYRDLGNSMIYPGRVVLDEILNYGSVSFIMGIKGMLLGLILGVSGAILSIHTKSPLLKGALEVASLLLVSVPNFIIASFFYYLFSQEPLGINLIKLGGNNTGLAILVVALSITGVYMRYIREAVFTEMKKDYILQARAKGYRGMKLLFKHLLRNAMAPVISLILPQIAGLFIGFYIIEGIFSVPGFGNIYIDSINNKDYNMILGATVIFTLFYVITVYFTDIIYALLDPRIRRRKIHENR